jgi:predicted ATPase/class 3 adenylate cyclase
MACVCTNCSTESSDSASFCANCGTPLTSAADGLTRLAGNPDTSVLHRLGPRQYIEHLVSGHQKIRSERRIVTTLFADVVGSTAMAEKLDPEDVTDIMNGAFRVLTEPIENHDGTLARLMGDAVLCLFGAPQAHEDDPARACQAALDILERARSYDEELAAKYGIRFQVRIGITTGLAVVGEVGTDRRAEYTAMGDTVNLAARLQASAHPGTIRIDTRTRNRVTEVFDTDDVGPSAFKGKSEPVHVYELRQRRIARDASFTNGSAIPLVGRQAELKQLESAIDNCRSGQGGTLVIIGETGIGKTRLLQETQSRTAPGVLWNESRCMAHARDMSYWAAQDVLQGLMQIDPYGPASAAAQAFRHSMDFAYAPDVRESIPPRDNVAITAPLANLLNVHLDQQEEEYLATLSADQLRDHIRESFCRFIHNVASQGPLVLVWEDVHWIDSESLQVLTSLCATTADVPILLLLSARPLPDDERDPVAQLRECCGDAFCEIRLGPLPHDDCLQLLRHHSGTAPVPEATANRILTIAEGNPFCIEEMLRSLAITGQLQSAPTQPSEPQISKEITVPAPVQAAILARLDRLPVREKKVLQAAAVIGRVFHPDVLHRVLEPRLPISDLTEALGTLETMGFLTKAVRGQPGASSSITGGFASGVRLARPAALSTYGTPTAAAPQFAFKHAVAAEVIYQSLLKSERRALHARAATVIEGLFPDNRLKLAQTLAYHFEKGRVSAKACEYLLINAEHAKDMCALDRALDCYNRAQRHVDKAEDHPTKTAHRARLLEGCADVHYLRGEYPEAESMYDEALSLEKEPRRRASILRMQSRVFEKSGQWERAQQVLEYALATIEDEPDEKITTQIYAGLSTVFCHQDKLEEARDVGEAALELARRHAVPRAEAQAFVNLGLIMSRRKEWQQARDYYEKARMIYDRVGDRFGLATCFNNLGCLDKDQQNWERASEHFRSSLALFERLHNRHAMARVYDNLSEVLLEMGDSVGAQEYLEKAVGILAEVGADSSGPVAEMWQSGIW